MHKLREVIIFNDNTLLSFVASTMCAVFHNIVTGRVVFLICHPEAFQKCFQKSGKHELFRGSPTPVGEIHSESHHTCHVYFVNLFWLR